MTWFLLWVFVTIEKITAAIASMASLVTWGVVLYIGAFVLAVLISKDRETLSENNSKFKVYRRIGVAMVIVGAMSSFVSTVMPDKKELAMIIGGGVTWNVLTSDTSKELGGKVIQLLNKELDEAINTTTSAINENAPAIRSAAEELKDAAVERSKEAAKDVISGAIEGSR